MRTFMHESAVGGADILRPLLFNVNQCPLPAAECKMLQARKHQVIFLAEHHIRSMISGLTPSISASVIS